MGEIKGESGDRRRRRLCRHFWGRDRTDNQDLTWRPIISDTMCWRLRRRYCGVAAVGVLTDAATHGLPGEHHFFIHLSLRSRQRQIVAAAACAISGRDDHHPAAPVLVDLVVSEDRFEVGLSFGGIPERLVVPFSAIKSFFDPSVQFGLQFEPAEGGMEAPRRISPPAAPAPSSALAVPAPRTGGRAGRRRTRQAQAKAPKSCGSIASAQEIIRTRRQSGE